MPLFDWAVLKDGQVHMIVSRASTPDPAKYGGDDVKHVSLVSPLLLRRRYPSWKT